MSNITWLEITFENIDWVRIPGKYLLDVAFDKLPAPPDLDGSSVFPKTDRISVLLSQNILSKNARYKKDWPESGWKDLISRLKQNDITSVDICYHDGTREHHNADWEDAPDNEYVNQYQKVWIDSNGNIAITICKENGNE